MRKPDNAEPKPHFYPMGLWNLNSSMYSLKIYPLQIVVEEWPDNEFVAHWHDVEAVGFGDNKEEAINDLCESIIDLYQDLTETKDEELGKIPLRAKRILQQAIERTSVESE